MQYLINTKNVWTFFPIPRNYDYVAKRYHVFTKDSKGDAINGFTRDMGMMDTSGTRAPYRVGFCGGTRGVTGGMLVTAMAMTSTEVIGTSSTLIKLVGISTEFVDPSLVDTPC